MDVLEDAERSGSRKEQELGILSIKRFKRMARQRFADTIIDFKAQVERKKTKVVEVQKPETGGVDLLEKEEEVKPPNIVAQQGEMGLEKVDQPWPDIKVDKRSHLAGAWRLRLWKEIVCQSEERQNLGLKVETVDLWKTRLKSEEEASEDKVAGLDPGDGVEVQQRAET